MFSSEAMISLANGSLKSINNLNINDVIYNKLKNPVKISNIDIIETNTVANVLLNNGTGVFYCDPSSLFYCHLTNDTGVHIGNYSQISDIYAQYGKLKSSCKLFSPESDISISTYEISNNLKTLYSIHTIDSDQTFFVNGVIAKCQSN